LSLSAGVSQAFHVRAYRGVRAVSIRAALLSAALFATGLVSGGCSLTFPMFSAVSQPASEPQVLVTGSAPRAPSAKAVDALLSDHLGPEDMRRAYGAMALALDPQGNGSPVSWDNAESRSNGRFTPVGGPFLRDHEVCRAFLAQARTLMDQHQMQGTACRPSGGEWSITELKPWRQPS
jgi:surface antigen